MNTLVCVHACVRACTGLSLKPNPRKSNAMTLRKRWFRELQTWTRTRPQDQTTGPDHRESFRTRRATPSQ